MIDRSVLLSHLGVLHVSERPYFHKPSFPSKNLRVFFGNTMRLWVFQKASRAASQGINGPFIQLQRLHLIGLVSRRKTGSPFRLGVGRYSGIPTNHQTVQINEKDEYMSIYIYILTHVMKNVYTKLLYQIHTDFFGEICFMSLA